MKLSFLASVTIGILLALAYLYFYPIKPAQIAQEKSEQQQIGETQFSLEKAPSEALQGKITSLTGDVEWRSRTATQASSISTPIPILQGEELATKDIGKVTLAFTGLTINLSKQTSLNVIQTLPANLVFTQDMGEAVYEKSIPTPVSIRSLNLLINLPKEEGKTTISIDDSIVTISAQKGSLTAAFNSLNNITTLVKINEGEDYIFNDETRKGTLE